MALRSSEVVKAYLDLERAGIVFEVAGDKLLAWPPSKITDELRQLIILHRDEIMAITHGCPECKRRMIRDNDRCWRCNWRRCESCGGNTASAFIGTCIRCQMVSGVESRISFHDEA